MPYATPDAQFLPLIEASPPPVVALAPGGAFLALSHYRAHPEVSVIARPYLPLAGLRIDPDHRARRRTRQSTALSVVTVADGRERTLPLGGGAPTTSVAWAPDGRRLAVGVAGGGRIGLWLADAGTGATREIAGFSVCDILAGDPSPTGGAFRWSRDGRSLLVLATPASATTPAAPSPEPVTRETAGQHAEVATYQDLLRDEAGADMFTALATSVPCRVDATTGQWRELGPPGLYCGLVDSPDGEYLLVRRLRRPYSFRVPWFWFARRSEIWGSAGESVRVIADLPATEEVPREGVPEGPRLVSWEERAPAVAVWVEALDGGDPIRPAEHRDRVLRLAAPFDGSPATVRKVRHRCLGWHDLAEPHQVMLVEHDRDRRWRTTWLADLATPARDRVLFDRSADDVYADPGTPMDSLNPDGSWTAAGQGNAVYLRGQGASPEGKRPFLDSLDLTTGTATRLHQAPPGRVERVLGITGAPGGPDVAVVTWCEAPAEPPNLWAGPAGKPPSRALTRWPHPYPELAGVSRRLVTHDRGDGVQLSGLLHLPPGHDPAAQGRLPLVVWAYPDDYGEARTAGQIRAGTYDFTRLPPLGPALFALAGFAVLAEASMPVLGDPETKNDTYLEQIGAAARAHIQSLDAAGLIDPARVAVGGHSYGAFMTANLLAHTDLFAAGIARSGAYNRTLTPFGFQTERRSLWEATEVYDRVSPLRYADRITAPLLLIHGERDSNSGTYPEQSERLFQAIQGTGGTARLVMLPFEDHAYAARESVAHVIAEELAWLRRWLA